MAPTPTQRGPAPGAQGASGSLLRHVADLRRFSSGLLALTELAPERLSAPQATFFLFAGLADLSGKPATFTELKEFVGESISRSLHTTYKVFLTDEEREPRRQVALGWLLRETDRADNRRKYLRLTNEGRRVITEIIDAITGD